MIPHVRRAGFSPSFVPGTSKPINFTEARSKTLLTRPEGWVISVLNHFPAKRGSRSQGPEDEPRGNPATSPHSTHRVWRGFQGHPAPTRCWSHTGSSDLQPSGTTAAWKRLRAEECPESLEMGTNCSSWHRGTIPSVTSRGAGSSLLVSATQARQQCPRCPSWQHPQSHRDQQLCSPVLAVLQQELKCFKAIKQGLSKDFNAFKCNVNGFKAKQAQVAMMILKHPAPSATLRTSSSESWPVSPVTPAARLHPSPHPIGKLDVELAAFSVKQESGAVYQLWRDVLEVSFRTVPGPRLSWESTALSGTQGTCQPAGDTPMCMEPKALWAVSCPPSAPPIRGSSIPRGAQHPGLLPPRIPRDREGAREAPRASKEAWGNAGSGEHLG